MVARARRASRSGAANARRNVELGVRGAGGGSAMTWYMRIGIGSEVGWRSSPAGSGGRAFGRRLREGVVVVAARSPSSEPSRPSEHDGDDNAGDGRHDGGRRWPSGASDDPRPLRDAVGNPCIPRYVDPVRVGSPLRGSTSLDRADGTPPPRHRAARARARRARGRPAPHALARRHVRHGRPVHPNGPVAINILTGPRPGGTTTLAPSLSNDTLTGRETLTAIERRTAPQATTAGINGDFFTFATGVAERRPHAGRAGDEPAVGLSRERRRHLRRARSTSAGSTLSGTWQGPAASAP